MRGSGPWKPKAMRVRSRILVLVDSMRPLERPTPLLEETHACSGRR